MPAANWFGTPVKNMYDGTDPFDWNTDDIRISLHTATYAPSKDADDYWNDATNEISGTGYTAGGQAITSPTVTYDSATDEIRLDHADPSWGSSSFTARIAVWYKKKGGASTADPLIGYLDFGSDQTVSSGTFSIAIDSTGAFKLDAT